jgi:hypothetical protein
MVMLFEHVHDPWQAQLPSDELSPRCSMVRLARRRQLHAELLPKAEHDATERRAAIQALMLVVEHGGHTMLPRTGITRARI